MFNCLTLISPSLSLSVHRSQGRLPLSRNITPKTSLGNDFSELKLSSEVRNKFLTFLIKHLAELHILALLYVDCTHTSVLYILPEIHFSPRSANIQYISQLQP